MGLQPPPPAARSNTGAGLWVLLAIGLSIGYSFISDSDDSVRTLDWAVSAAITVIWVVAARNALTTIGKVILWLIVFAQAAFWVLALGLFVAA